MFMYVRNTGRKRFDGNLNPCVGYFDDVTPNSSGGCDNFFSSTLDSKSRASSDRSAAEVLVPDVPADDLVTRYFRRCLQEHVESENIRRAQRQGPDPPDPLPPARRAPTRAKTAAARRPLGGLVRAPGSACPSLPRASHDTTSLVMHGSSPVGNELVIHCNRRVSAKGRRNVSLMSDDDPNMFAGAAHFPEAVVAKLRHFLGRETALRRSIEGDESVERGNAYYQLTRKIDFLIYKQTEIPKLVEQERCHREHVTIDENKRFSRVMKTCKYEFVLTLDIVRRTQISDAWQSIYAAMKEEVDVLSSEEQQRRHALLVLEARQANILQVRLHKLTTLLLEWPALPTPPPQDLSQTYEFCYPVPLFREAP